MNHTPTQKNSEIETKNVIKTKESHTNPKYNTNICFHILLFILKIYMRLKKGEWHLLFLQLINKKMRELILHPTPFYTKRSFFYIPHFNCHLKFTFGVSHVQSLINNFDVYLRCVRRGSHIHFMASHMHSLIL